MPPQGPTVDFGNTVVIMASSIGSELMQGVTVDGEIREDGRPLVWSSGSQLAERAAA